MIVFTSLYVCIFSGHGCPNPGMGNNSHIVNEVDGSWTFDEEVQYECEYGYIYSSGSVSSTCLYDKNNTYWSDPPLICSGKSLYITFYYLQKMAPFVCGCVVVCGTYAVHHFIGALLHCALCDIVAWRHNVKWHHTEWLQKDHNQRATGGQR